ncbi:hypothetical protein D3C81_1792340 [compost metagenome]
MRLHGDGGLGRVDADRQVIQRHFQYVAAHLVGIVRIVGHGLGVGQQQVLLMRILQRHAALQRADEVAEMQRAGGTVAGQDHGTPVGLAGLGCHGTVLHEISRGNSGIRVR